MFYKVASALVLSILLSYVLTRHIKLGSDISFRSRIELFLGGFVSGVAGLWLLSSDIVFWTRLLICTVGGIIGGIGLAYRSPRQWRETQDEMEKRRQNKSNQ